MRERASGQGGEEGGEREGERGREGLCECLCGGQVLRAGKLYSALAEHETASVLRLRLAKMADIH
eukprot:3507512-Rhodomonas_salina.1